MVPPATRPKAEPWGGIVEKVSMIGDGIIRFPYLEYAIQRVPPMRAIPRETGVGSTMKPDTRQTGTVFRETGTADPLVVYPFVTVYNQEFAFWPDLNGGGIPASGSFNVWTQTFHNLQMARCPVEFEHAEQRAIYESGMIARLISCLTARNLHLFYLIATNSVLSPILSGGVGGLIPTRGDQPEYGRGRYLSKTGLIEAMHQSSLMVQGLTKQTQEVLLYAASPIVGMVEFATRRYLNRIGMNGLNLVSQPDQYSIRIGNIYCIQHRLDGRLDMDGVFSEEEILGEIDQLVQSLLHIWPRVVEVIKKLCVQTTPYTSPSYLDGILKFRSLTGTISDEDWLYAKTMPLAEFDGLGNLNTWFWPWRPHNGFNRASPGPTDLDVHYQGHPYRPPFWCLEQVLSLGPMALNIAALQWTLFIPIAWHDNAGNFLNAVIAGAPTNVLTLNWPHQPVDATMSVRPRFTFTVMDATLNAEDFQAFCDPVFRAFMEASVAHYGGTTLHHLINDTLDVEDKWYAWSKLAPFGRYTNNTRPVLEVSQLPMEWINAFFDGEDVRPTVWWHLSGLKSSPAKVEPEGRETGKTGPFKDTTKDKPVPKSERIPSGADAVAAELEEPKVRAPRAAETPEAKKSRKDKRDTMSSSKGKPSTGGFIPPDKWAKMSKDERDAVIAKRKK